MTISQPIRSLILLWLAWLLILLGYQWLVDLRYQPNRPDRALDWTPSETARTSQRDKPYLIEPFLNAQVSWDSEFYLSIATVGYDDPLVRSVPVKDGRTLSLNYAFFPLYPALMAGLNAPLRLLGLNPIATSTLSGLLVAALGTLGGLIALYYLARAELGQEGALRAAFYLLIFPSGLFLAQVYTEGLFLALAFGSLALMDRRHLLAAAVLAALACWTRAIGLALIFPLALTWARTVDWPALRAEGGWRRALPALAPGILLLAPLAAYLIWRATLGDEALLVEEAWFGRELFNWKALGYGLERIARAFNEGGNAQMMVYYALEMAVVALVAVSGLATLRRHPNVALFSLIALVLAVTSGAPQSLIRYALTAPALFIFLGRLGRSPLFDRSWTMISLLLLAMLAALFTFDMWVA